MIINNEDFREARARGCRQMFDREGSHVDRGKFVKTLTFSSMTHCLRSQLVACLGQRLKGRQFYISSSVEVFYCVVFLESN